MANYTYSRNYGSNNGKPAGRTYESTIPPADFTWGPSTSHKQCTDVIEEESTKVHKHVKGSGTKQGKIERKTGANWL